jgi:hypothetical protein
LTTVRAMGNLRAKSVDFPLAIRSRWNSLGQETLVLTFDGTLIDDTGLETIVFQTLLESPVSASNVDNPTLFGGAIRASMRLAVIARREFITWLDCCKMTFMRLI